MNTEAAMTTTRKHWIIFWLAWAVWLIASVAVARAGPRTFQWDANPAEDLVVKYVLYERLTPGWTKVGESTATELVIPVAPGTHTYAVTAVSLSGEESERSNELTFTEPVNPPKNLRIALQISTDLQTWQTVAEHDAGDVPRVFASAVFAH